MFKGLIKKTEKALKFKKNVNLGLILVNDQEIKKINKIYRNKNQATDVISFAFNESEKNPKENYLGEIFISFDTAKKQAQDLNHSLEYELKFLFTHGLLHIFGYDHHTDKEENEMNSVADKILK